MFRLILFTVIILSSASLQAQRLETQLGANYNHDPDLIENELLARAGVRWVRVTPRFFRYMNGELDPATDEGLQHIIRASNAGYKVVFGFRFDFHQNERIPIPNSQREREMFDVIGSVIARIGEHIDIFTLGNEPNLETVSADMVFQESHGGIPLVVFTQRLLDEVVEPFYDRRPSFRRPEIYGGSIPAIFQTSTQNNDAVRGLLQMANDDDRIAGFDLHFHIESFDEVDAGFEFARSIMPEKPFLITEFSLHRLYRSKIEEPLNATEAGTDFANIYGYDPTWKSYQWYTVVNSQRVTPDEFKAFFDSRDWYPQNYLDLYREKFNQYGVYLATYPILQQSAPQVLNPTSPLWFINPVYMQVSLEREEDGSLAANPLCVDDYLEWASYRLPLGEVFEEIHDTIRLYPNPTEGLLQIDRGRLKGKVEITIHSLEGKELQVIEFSTDEIRLDLSGLRNGVYQLTLKSGQEVYSKKVFIVSK